MSTYHIQPSTAPVKPQNEPTIVPQLSTYAPQPSSGHGHPSSAPAGQSSSSPMEAPQALTLPPTLQASPAGSTGLAASSQPSPTLVTSMVPTMDPTLTHFGGDLAGSDDGFVSGGNASGGSFRPNNSISATTITGIVLGFSGLCIIGIAAFRQIRRRDELENREGSP